MKLFLLIISLSFAIISDIDGALPRKGTPRPPPLGRPLQPGVAPRKRVPAGGQQAAAGRSPSQGVNNAAQRPPPPAAAGRPGYRPGPSVPRPGGSSNAGAPSGGGQAGPRPAAPSGSNALLPAAPGPSPSGYTYPRRVKQSCRPARAIEDLWWSGAASDRKYKMSCANITKSCNETCEWSSACTVKRHGISSYVRGIDTIYDERSRSRTIQGFLCCNSTIMPTRSCGNKLQVKEANKLSGLLYGRSFRAAGIGPLLSADRKVFLELCIHTDLRKKEQLCPLAQMVQSPIIQPGQPVVVIQLNLPCTNDWFYEHEYVDGATPYCYDYAITIWDSSWEHCCYICSQENIFWYAMCYLDTQSPGTPCVVCYDSYDFDTDPPPIPGLVLWYPYDEPWWWDKKKKKKKA